MVQLDPIMCLTFTVHLLIAHVRAVTNCAHDNPVCAAPTQKCNGNTVGVEPLHELPHTVHNDSSLRVTSLSGGAV